MNSSNNVLKTSLRSILHLLKQQENKVVKKSLLSNWIALLTYNINISKHTFHPFIQLILSYFLWFIFLQNSLNLTN